MNNAVSMGYRGKPYTFDEVKKVKIGSAGPWKEYTKRWGDHYAGIPKSHPLKLQGIISEILTENGWKFFKDLKNEMVATLNVKQDKFEWQRPTNYVDEHYNGEMIHFRSKI